MSEQVRKSKIQEKRITRDLTKIGDTAKRQKASGAMWNHKSDVISQMFQVEAKTRLKPSKSIIMKKEWLDKIEGEALQDGRIPVLVFSFGDGKDYYCLPQIDFMALVNELIELRGASE